MREYSILSDSAYLNTVQDKFCDSNGSVTGDTALRLGHWSRSAQFWLNLQTAYDLRLAEQAAGAEIKTLPVMSGTKKPEQPNLL